MSRTKVLTVLLVVCLVIVYVYLGMDYLKQRRGHTALRDQMQNTVETLALLPQPPADLAERLAAAQKVNEAARESIIPQTVSTTAVIETILHTGDDYRLRLTPLRTDPWSERDIEGRAYRVFRINLLVEGGAGRFCGIFKAAGGPSDSGGG